MWYNLFYFLGIIGLLFEWKNLINPTAAFLFKKDSETIADQPAERQLEIGKKVFFVILPYIIWTYAGLFTHQWPLFVILLILGYVTKYLVKKGSIRDSIKYIRIDALVSLICIIFIMFRGITV
jgi:hypothetical protein